LIFSGGKYCAVLLDNVRWQRAILSHVHLMEISPCQKFALPARPEPPRVQQERPVKTEQKVKNDPPPKMEPQREVVRQEVRSNDKPKGGNVDITV